MKITKEMSKPLLRDIKAVLEQEKTLLRVSVKRMRQEEQIPY